MRILSSLLLFVALSLPYLVSSATNPIAWPDDHTLSLSARDPVIDSKLIKILSSKTNEEPTAIWVFFTDKGIFDDTDYLTSLEEATTALIPTTRERRRKVRGADNLVDFRDLPVEKIYIDQVLSTGAELRHRLRWFNAVTVDATVPQIESIQSLVFVRYIKAVSYSKSNIDIEIAPISPDLTLVSLDYGPSYGQLDQINVIAAHELGFKGQDVIVCMMDTGYRQGHDAFQNIIDSGRLIAQYDFINGDDDTDYDPDQEGESQPYHGTLTWSTLGGEASGYLYGPAYMASFVLSKSEDISSERHIEEDNWAAGAEWAESLGASVISASLGYRWFDSGEGDYSYSDLDGNTTIVTIAADLAAYNGIAVATAMGNEGNFSGSLIAPADGDSVIACGAVNSYGELAGFSSYGPTSDGQTKPEVCAQGVGTVCVNPYDNSGYSTASGTSLSTPLIGGVSAVLFSAHPNWTSMMVREALMMTADRFDSPGNEYGWGIVDAGRALYYHPAGDIVFDHTPLLYSESNQPMTVDANITGGAGIANAYLYYKVNGIGGFTEIAMSTSNGQDFTGGIPGLTGDYVQYYMKAVDNDGNYAFHPIGGENHPVRINLDLFSINDSFEDGPQLWKSGGTNNFWGISAKYANGGNLSITDSPTTLYRANTDSWLESAFSLDLTGVSEASFSFSYRGELQNGSDYLYIEASTDGGSTWNQFPQSITGSFPNFTGYSVSLNDYAGQADVRLRFHLVTNGSVQNDGIFIDDIAISAVVSEDIPTLSQWGMILLGLLLLAVTTISVIQRRKTAWNSDLSPRI
ncbi:MAG: IPTL-CTERM sorting domain-containing protein [candidate division Zixibacteria bacterium]